jgi:ADP-heptose:LPS heptosyltransferase
VLLPIKTFNPTIGDLMDLAAVVQLMDVVVTVDTLAGHLAGALGVPVFLALGCGSDWRWLRTRSDTPWYPNTRLFRQERPGEWDSVFEKIADTIGLLLPCQRCTQPRSEDIRDRSD